MPLLCCVYPSWGGLSGIPVHSNIQAPTARNSTTYTNPGPAGLPERRSHLWISSWGLSGIYGKLGTEVQVCGP